MKDPLEEQATRFVDQVRRRVAYLRYGSPELRLAFVGSTFLAIAPVLTRLPSVWLSAIPKSFQPWISTPFWLAGGICFVLVVFRMYRRVAAPLPEGEAKMPALKGAASFTPEDASLFARLGRDAEVEQLRAWILDDQKPLIVVMGESGVGKTSLLRAGLAHALKKDGIEVMYWEAFPTDPAKGLIHAIGAAWGKTKSIPENLKDLPSGIAADSRVVALDQFEQLSPEANPEIFKLLEQVLLTSPPYRAKWIVAFRREYSATWIDFTLRLPEAVRSRVEMLSLNRFPLPMARRVVAVLAAEAQLPIDQKIVEELVDGIAVDGRVSPVDIGVTLLGLEELVGQEGAARVSLADFRASGGPAGLLTRYLERQLEYFPPLEQSELVAALLALIDLDSNQRRAQGLPLSELIDGVRPVSHARFGHALKFLASWKARVLEVVPELSEEPCYRLLHERFIEPVRILSGTRLAESAQAALRLDLAFRAWSRDRRWRYLLMGSELRLVLRHRKVLLSGAEAPAKREFLRRSRRRRLIFWSTVAGSALGLFALVTVVPRVLSQRELAVELRASGLPGDLGDYLDQLKTLEIQRQVTRVDWLSRASHLRSLSMSAKLDNPMELPPSVEELTCQSCINLKNLRLPPHLRSLKLGSVIGDLPYQFPASLESLNLSYFLRSQKGLPQSAYHIPRVASLELNLNIASDADSRVLWQLPPGVTNLNVFIMSALILRDLSWVPKTVTSLNIVEAVSGSNLESLRGAPSTLRSLGMSSSNCDLRALPSGLVSLRITRYEKSSAVLNLEGLHNLREAEISGSFTDVRLPSGLTSASVSTSMFSSIRLPTTVTRLSLSGGELSDMKRLPQGLESLMLFEVRVRSWAGLPRLLSLHLHTVDAPEPLVLPQTLQSLKLIDSPLTFAELPPHLQSLFVVGKWHRRGLPATLRSLDISQIAEGPERLEDFGSLPPRLESLTLPASVTSLRGLPRSVRELRMMLTISEFQF